MNSIKATVLFNPGGLQILTKLLIESHIRDSWVEFAIYLAKRVVIPPYTAENRYSNPHPDWPSLVQMHSTSTLCDEK
ncbi:hypothetical protein ANCDUO_10215 [Ancylostoma duodenale]|uniref:Uncharacterized protein n=1 Tax=Ancylostoma duodenale TaxID=51022 RepID=A0A0C2GED9_9BILA|nr:hypothetical protein ANCDUO_10215 [Ancylostoma duodenale]